MAKKDSVQDKKIFTAGRFIAALVLLALFLAAWKWMPRDFSLKDRKVFPFLCIAAAAILSLSLRIKLPEWARKSISFLALFVLPALWLFMTEYAVDNKVQAMKTVMLLLGYIIYLFAALVLLFVTGRIGLTAILGTAAFTAHAIINTFVTEARGYGIRTTDIAAARTAMNVASEYALIIHARQARVLLLAAVLICFGLHNMYRIKWKTRFAAGALAAVAAAGMLFVLYNDSFMDRYEVRPYMWYAKESCTDHGALLEIAAGIPYLKVKSPAGYSAETADRLEETGASRKAMLYSGGSAAAQGGRPDIIVVMNESLSDLRNCGPFETDQEYMEYFYTLQENVISGMLSVPVQGGITANTEFEFLTGFSNAYLPAGVIAFQNYVRENTPCINDVLKENGYYSIFMHPYLKTGWNRVAVYENFGFDEVDWEEEFEGRDRIRGYISDSGDYKELIEKYEAAAQKEQNVFLFNVTMQNHGGYKAEDYESTVHLLDMEGTYPEAEQYLSLIRESDKALEELVTYFAGIDRPVLLCVFGDHTPAVEPEFYTELAGRAGYDSFEKGVKIHQTPFIIYANYDIAEKQYDNISVNYLPALLLDAAGIEKDSWFGYLADSYRKYPVINLFGVRDISGNWYSWTEAEKFPEIAEYAVVQYRNLFDRK